MKIKIKPWKFLKSILTLPGRRTTSAAAWGWTSAEQAKIEDALDVIWRYGMARDQHLAGEARTLLLNGRLLPANLRQRPVPLDGGYHEPTGMVYLAREAVSEYDARHLAHPLLNEMYHWRSPGDTEDADHAALAQGWAVLVSRWEAANGRGFESEP